MKPSLFSSLHRRLQWLNLPTAVLIALLQRSPVIRMLVAVEETVTASPVGALIKSVAAAAAALGAVNSMAGATPLVPSAGTETGITVTANVSVSIGYTANSPLGPASSWNEVGTLPPGMSFLTNGSDALINGRPTTPGSYPITLKAFGPNGEEVDYGYTITVVAGNGNVAPSFTTQPAASQTVTAGASVSFTVVVAGTPAPTIQWKKGTADVAGATGATLTLPNVQTSDAGSYTAIATNAAGTATSSAAVLTVNPSLIPAITTQPAGHTVAVGSSVVFGVEATGGGLSYQWKKDSVDIAGATLSQLLLANSQPSDAGNYTVAVTNSSGGATSTPAALSVVTSNDPGRIINVSVRIVSGANDNVLLVGFVAGGAGTTGNKDLLIRGVGPTLTGFGVPSAMVDPILQIIPAGTSTVLASNDNWGGDATVISTANSVGAFSLPDTASKDAALVASLPGGVYSAKVSGANNTTGTVLAEIYDAHSSVFDPTVPRLVNVSARAQTANDNPLIAGFVITGSTAKTVMIRAIGPFLNQYVGAAAMPDPLLQVFVRQSNVDHLLLTNDNWGGSALITSTGHGVGAFDLTDPASKDAVLLVTLDPGVYSAEVLGVNNASGIALVEIYDIP